MLKEGTVLDGKYEVLKKIGEGGMSVVYLARNNRLNMQLAVKEMKNDGSKSTEVLLKGLEREANILKDVDHPVIPRIVDIVKYKNTICVVMDFIEGENLLDHLKKRGALEQEQAIKWSIQLADALKYLHSMNPPIIYRDMKPGNVMIKPDDNVKLIDFGTAKEFKDENALDTTALGTRGYAAPEQFGDAKGRGLHKTDARTDIYNLGATMYHMLTGKYPYEAAGTMSHIREVNPAVSVGLEKIIAKCTMAKPEDRYQNCSELIYALQHYTELDDKYIRENRRKVGLFIGASAAALLFGGLSIVGKAGMNRVERDNYYSYIEDGDRARALRKYDEASLGYQKAFNLKPEESEAYIKYIDLYISQANDLAATDLDETEEDSTPEEILQGGLNEVAGNLNKGNISAKNNSDVIYRLGLTYFSELSDYQTAAQYFAMIEGQDDANATYAKYYGSIAQTLSSPSPDVSSLVKDINNFADQTMNTAENNQEKFINYKTLGSIYVRYLNAKGVDGLAEKAEEVMTQAEEDLANYSGDDSADFDYAFSDDLSEIYFAEGKNANSVDYYRESISACQKVQSLALVKLKDADVQLTDTDTNDSAKAYIQKYIDKVNRIAEIYGTLSNMDGNASSKDDFTAAIDTYEAAENEIGTASANVASIYVAHLNFLYGEYEEQYGNDPAKWPETAQNTIIAVYTEGQNVPGIGNNHNWATRVSTMDKLADGSLNAQADSEKEQDANINQSESTDDENADEKLNSESGKESDDSDEKGE